MKKHVFALSLLVAATFAASASSRAADQPDKPKPPTVGEVLSIMAALNGIDAHQTGIVDNAGNPVTAPNNFRLGGAVRLAIAVNIDQGRIVIKSYQDALTALRVQIAGEGRDVPKEKLDEFNREHGKMLEAPSSALLARIKLADLCLDAAPPACPAKNEIPVSTLSLLLPIIDR